MRGRIVEFTIPGRVIPAKRMTQRSRWSPQAQRYLSYRGHVGWCARPHFPASIAGPVGICARIFIHHSRADLDNELKAIFDGLNGVAWRDDRQVVEVCARRLPCAPGEERVEIKIEELEEARAGA